MPPQKLELAPEQVAEAQRLYENALAPLHDIAAMLGVSRDTLRNRIQDWGWTRRRHSRGTRAIGEKMRGATPAAVTAPDASQRVLPPVAPERRAALAGCIVDIVEDQMNAVKRVLATVQPKDQVEAEHSTRMIASIGHILRDTVALFPSDKTTPHAADPDDVPRDIDEFRHALARRIEAFVAAHAGEDEATADDAGEPGDQAE